MKPNKYGNKKITIDGISFDSKKEAFKYRELKILEKAGIIKNLKLQPRYELQPKFKKNGKSFRKIEYVSDFEYAQDGKIIVEDTKGFLTDIYRLKLKMFEYNFPELTIKET